MKLSLLALLAAARLMGAAPDAATAAALPTAATSLGAVSPSGSAVAVLRRDGAVTSALILDREGRLLKSYNLSNLKVRDLAFYDEDHLAITRLVIDPGGRATSRQALPRPFPMI